MTSKLITAMADPLFWLSLMQIELEDYQLEIFLNLSRYASNRLIVNKSRQVGLSWLICLYALIMCHIRNDVTAIFVSYRQTDSAEKIKRIKELYKLIPSEFQQKIVVDNRTSLQFENGSEILSEGKNHVRGSDSNRFLIILLDEFAFYGNFADTVYTSLQGLWTRAKPGSCLIIVSTPFMEKGKFYEIWQGRNQYKNYRRFLIQWWHYKGNVKDGMLEEAKRIAPLLDTETRVRRFGSEKLIEIFDGMSLAAFQQEFESAFSSSVGCYFGTDLEQYFENDYQYCLTFEEIHEKYSSYDIYAGYDIASAEGRDKSALFVLVDVDGILIPVYKQELKTKFKDQKKILEEFIETVSPHTFVFEENGIGKNLAEDLKDKYGDLIVRHNTTQRSKAEDFATIKTMLEKEQLKLVEDIDLMLQMAGVRLKQGKNGRALITIDRNSEGHGDAVMALSLAVRAWKLAHEYNDGWLGYGRY